MIFQYGSFIRNILLPFTIKLRMKYPALFLLSLILLCRMQLLSINIDSLTNILRTSKEDTNKVKLLCRLSVSYTHLQLDSALKYANHSLELSNKLDYMHGKLLALNLLAQCYHGLGDLNKSLKYLNEKMELLKNSDDKVQISTTLGNIGLIYLGRSDHEKALDYMFKALKIDEELKNSRGVCRHFGNIAGIFIRKKDFDKAAKYYLEAYNIAVTIKDQEYQMNMLGSIGDCYYEKYDLKSSLKYYYKALAIADSLGLLTSQGVLHNNIGNVFDYKGDIYNENDRDTISRSDYYSIAMSNYSLSLELGIKSQNKDLIISSRGNLGDLYITLGKFKEAEKMLQLALAEADSLGDLSLMKQQHSSLADLYNATGNFVLALQHYKNYMLYRDSIMNEEQTRRSVELEMNYEFEKKEALAKQEQEKKDIIALEEKQLQNMIRNVFIGGFALVVLLAIFILRGYRNKQRDNILITRQKEEVEKAKLIIEEQKDLVEEKQKEILDSIHYARRIQKALITNEKYIERTLAKMSSDHS